MKRLLSLLVLAFTLSLCSCGTVETVAYTDGYGYANVTTISSFEYSYYDYNYGYPVVYYGTIPYYRIWYRDKWFYHPVPADRFRFILRLDRPRVFRNDMHVHRGIMDIRREYGPRYFDKHPEPRHNGVNPPPPPRREEPRNNVIPQRQQTSTRVQPSTPRTNVQRPNTPSMKPSTASPMMAPRTSGGVTRGTGRR